MLPLEGEEVVKDDSFGRIITANQGSFRLYSPVNGEIIEVNEDVVEESPELIQEDPYGDGWLLRVEIPNTTEYDNLMTRAEYEDLLNEEDPRR